MTGKLTLSIDAEVIKDAKVYALKTGRSLSGIVENYLKGLQREHMAGMEKYSPIVRELKGILDVTDDFDYKKVLEEEIGKKHMGS